MKSIIEAFYDGKIRVWERKVVMTDERREIEKNIQREKQYFSEKMSPDDYQRLERLENLFISADHSEDVDLYTYSFSLGALLMLEILDRRDGLINE